MLLFHSVSLSPLEGIAPVLRSPHPSGSKQLQLGSITPAAVPTFVVRCGRSKKILPVRHCCCSEVIVSSAALPWPVNFHQVPLLVHRLFKEPLYLRATWRTKLLIERERMLPDFYSILMSKSFSGILNPDCSLPSVLQRFRRNSFFLSFICDPQHHSKLKALLVGQDHHAWFLPSSFSFLSYLKYSWFTMLC